MNTTAGTVIAVTGKNSLSDGLIKGSGASLTALARAINIQSLLAKGKALAAIKHATECGRLLLEVKENLAHGEFGPWIKANCEFSVATANNYMKVANNPNALGNSTALRHLYLSGTPADPKKVKADHDSVPDAGDHGDQDLAESADEYNPEIMIQCGRTKQRLRASTPLTWLGFGLDNAYDEIKKAIARYEELVKRHPEVAQFKGRETIEEVATKLRKLQGLCANAGRIVAGGAE